MANDLAGDLTIKGQIDVGGTLRSSIDYDGDADWVAVDFVAGATYRITMDGTSGTGSLAYALIHSIRDSDGAHIAGSSNAGGLNGTAETWFTATETGTHYIDARATYNSGSTYNLRVTEMTDDIGSDASSAAALAVGGRATGSIDTLTDTDWFAATLEAGETYRVKVLGSESEDGTLARPMLAGIFEPDGDLVPYTVQAATGEGLNTDWLYTATESGVFHFAAGGHLHHRGTYAIELNQALTLRGSEGADWLTVPEGADLISVDGGTGRDMLSFVNLPGAQGHGVGVDLDANTATLFAASRTIDLVSIEDATGTGYADIFLGSDRAEIFRGLGGDDLFYGSDGGADVYQGGDGSDTLSYESSHAAVSVSLLKGTGWMGDARKDVISDIENLIGTAHDDFIWGDNSDNRLEGGLGDDTIVGNGGDDVILAGEGHDTIIFTGNRADYNVVQDGTRTEVTHLADGVDGHDIIDNAEVLRFTDGDMMLGDIV
ncbi:hypothetical protein N4R57_19785 [Rhodobacteraceae bacterium D3-12]|nr:hypothetical protein N4R57_19785 [Rhodobacteraceae bacterium D3-12]